ncbi:hypothetical protein R9C00_26065 [Flammeovirgaceae bacterium SG7u.111]|nr:hypothetical protein [Flammeovirgaceae bacterium SG7u.132]WPO35164.1 hypothetical protein R9C00_26065 [Flammeovirgaceae bacterium SG7u.111]
MTLRQFYILFFFLLVFSNDSYELKYFKYVINDDLIHHIEESAPDEIFLQHQDSLNAYFGNLEITLLQKHKENHDNIQTPEDFQQFFRNAITLRSSMHQKLQRRAEYFKVEKGVTELPDASWFNEVAVGMEVKLVNKLNYRVIFDYNDFMEKARNTEGKADDEYMILMMDSFDPETNFPAWLKMTPDGKVCSVLGSGVHTELLLQMNKALAEGDIFYQEVNKVKKQIINDIVFSTAYYKDYKKALSEMERIKNEVELDENDTELILTRLNNFKQPNFKKDVTFSLERSQPVAQVR